MTGRPPRLLAVVLTVALIVASGACTEDGDGGGDAVVDRTTTTAGAARGESVDSTTTTPTAETTSTAAAGAPTSAAPAAGGDAPGDGVIELTITGGNVEGGARREPVKQGAQVTIRVTSDAADELHVHTYDLKLDLVPGQSADLTFLARIPGVFEVELEERRTKVLELEVRP